MYVRMLKRGTNVPCKAGTEKSSGWKIVFDGWFPEETDESKILELLNSEVPGVAADGKTEYKQAETVIEFRRTHEAEPVFKTIDGDYAEKPEPVREISNKGRGNDCLMLVLLPGERPYAAVIPEKLEELQRAVNGYIEFTYPFDDNCVVIGNDEAKLIGMKGNRRINGEIYAGPLLFAGDDFDGGLCSLTTGQIMKYGSRFAEPENISDKDVDDSIKIEVFVI